MSSPLPRSSKPARLSPFFRDLASPISPHHRSGGRIASSPSKAAAASALWKENLVEDDPPPPPVFTLDDRTDFSPDPGIGDPPLPFPVSRSGSGRRTPTRLERKSSLSPSASFSSSSLALRTGAEVSGSVVLNGGAKGPGSSSSTSPKTNGWERGKGLASPVEGAIKPWALVTLPQPSNVARQEALRDDAEKGDDHDEKKWVTVFGFAPADTNLVLREFEKCGIIVKHIPGPRDANWIHILFQSIYDARKALEKNGIQINSMLMVGVKYVDRMHLQLLKETLKRTNRGEFMVSLPWKSAASNTADAPNSSISPTSKTAIINGRRPVATPANSLVSRVYDLIFGI